MSRSQGDKSLPSPELAEGEQSGESPARIQFKHTVADLPYDEQLKAIQPDLPPIPEPSWKPSAQPAATVQMKFEYKFSKGTLDSLPGDLSDDQKGLEDSLQLRIKQLQRYENSNYFLAHTAADMICQHTSQLISEYGQSNLNERVEFWRELYQAAVEFAELTEDDWVDEDPDNRSKRPGRSKGGLKLSAMEKGPPGGTLEKFKKDILEAGDIFKFNKASMKSIDKRIVKIASKYDEGVAWFDELRAWDLERDLLDNVALGQANALATALEGTSAVFGTFAELGVWIAENALDAVMASASDDVPRTKLDRFLAWGLEERAAKYDEMREAIRQKRKVNSKVGKVRK